MGTSQCRTTAKRAPRPPHASRPHSRAAFPPVPAPCLISLVSDSTSRLPCAEPTASTHLGEVATNDTHVPVTNLADRTFKKDPLNSRARSAGLARAVWRRVKGTSSWRREVPSGTGILRDARNESRIVVAACLRSAKRAIEALHPKQAHDANPVTNTTHLKLVQCANGPGKRKQ